ncbi:MAG: major capsid protein [Microviridae sp.]|nr:MAG: major capsid protein [Microviridae sp.]
MEKTLGGDRLGAGKKQKIEMHNYERSTHDLGYLWRSTMSAGTLVPFLKELALPGDTFDIELNCDVKTHPTIGPLFGSYKVQLDVFQAPIRLYQAALHNNMLKIGMKMSQIKLPIMEFLANPILLNTIQNIDMDNAQVNPSCILSYLGIRGIGWTDIIDTKRQFNAIPLLAYWDIYKNYYANKQEEIGAVIHSTLQADSSANIDKIEIDGTRLNQAPTLTSLNLNNGTIIVLTLLAAATPDTNQILIQTQTGLKTLTEIGAFLSVDPTGTIWTYAYLFPTWGNDIAINWQGPSPITNIKTAIEVSTFPLSEIDDMRTAILQAPIGGPFNVSAAGLEPYDKLFQTLTTGGKTYTTIMQNQEGLALKTYQSDLFNNWIQTDWIDGVDGITAITSIDTSGGSFQIDTLLMARKVYDMLNRIAVSGGTYNDWLDAVYTHERSWQCTTPMYMGGLSKELVFQEVVSNSASTGETGQPLGTLAGKGVMAHKHKGGKLVIKVDEPSYLIGIISLTPRIDYSQGNDWDIHLLTVDDIHKPALDQIGFQELIVEQMAWWSTTNIIGGPTDWTTISAGKQPAWINYMTNVNKVKGNFAINSNEMFMTLNRKYTPSEDGTTAIVEDITTYIDPAKFNNIFAQTSLDSQNFWTQIAVDMTARRKLSAKVMPNL